MSLPRLLGALAALTGLLVGCSSASEKPAAEPEASNTSVDRPLPAAPAPPACGDVLASMSIRDKLAQLLMVGVTGADDARAVVDNQHVGGIMIGSWTDLSMMGPPLADIAASAGPLPLAVSTDEEGGRVSRLADLIGAQPSPRVLAQTMTPDEVRGIAFQRGQAMRGLGVTIGFAPVVDVTTESDDEVIGDRSFGSDPAQVIAFAGAHAQGLRDAGVLPVPKHSPGHGQASGDSHEGGVVPPPLDELRTSDLIPY